MDYTAVGQTTLLAARMEQLADPGSIAIAPETLALAEGYVEVRSLGPVPVKGLDAPVETYELVGAGPRRSRLAASADRGLTKFVGRDAELEQLRQALGRAATGHGQVVALVGEAGVGKSRLVWEEVHSPRTHGWLIVQASSISYGSSMPYLPLVELLRGYCQIDPRDDARKVREKLTGKVLTLDPALQPAIAAFLALLDVPVEDPGWQALEPRQRHDRTLDAVKRLLLRESQIQPLLVVFEDLHWIDPQTQAFLDRLVESLPSARLVLLVNYRPEYQHSWGGKTYYTQLRLDPLSPDSAEALLHALLGDDRSVAPLTALLSERTEGNPFFLEESVRALVETGALVGERGVYRLTTAPTRVEMPATVQAILAARIDRIPPEDKRLLQVAAVIGREVPFALLEEVVGLPDDQLRRGLAHLQAAEFLYESRLFPDLAYTFKHALTHDVAYAALLHERRQALHGAVLAAIERHAGTGRAEHAEARAYHAVRAEIWTGRWTRSGRQERPPMPEGRSGRRWNGSSRPSSSCPGCRQARRIPDGRSMCGCRAHHSRRGARSRGSARCCARRNSSPATSMIRAGSPRRSGGSAVCSCRTASMPGLPSTRKRFWPSRRCARTPRFGSRPPGSSARYRAPSGDTARRSPGSSPSPMVPMPKWRPPYSARALRPTQRRAGG
jgi:AAA ATPase domain